MPLLELDAFGVDIGVTPVLGDITVRLAKGQTVGIAGASGAGKSILAKALGGLLPSAARTSGRIAFEGRPLPRDERVMARLRGSRIGLMLHDAALNPHAPISAQVAAAIGPATDANTVATLLTGCGFDFALGAARPDEVGTGDRRLAMLVIAVARSPDLLVADDPARGLDPVDAQRVLDALAHVVRSQHMTLLLLVAEPRVLPAICHEAMVLAGGRIVESGTPGSIFVRPQHEQTRAMIAARPRIRTLTQPPIGTHLLAARNLAFAARPADDISFEIRRSEALAVIGGARSGKTALARVVAGLDRARRGMLMLEHDRYHGSDLPPHRRREISLVFASPERGFDPRLPVGGAVTEPLRLEPQLLLEEQADRVMELIRAVGLKPDVLTERPAALDRASLIRLALARALIARPRLLVVDDFAAGLDLFERAEMLSLFSRLRSDYGLSCLLLTQDIDLAQALADRALVLDGGRIIEEGKPAELLEAPREAATRALGNARLPEIGQPRTVQRS